MNTTDPTLADLLPRWHHSAPKECRHLSNDLRSAEVFQSGSWARVYWQNSDKDDENTVFGAVVDAIKARGWGLDVGTGIPFDGESDDRPRIRHAECSTGEEIYEAVAPTVARAALSAYVSALAAARHGANTPHTL